MKFIQHPTNFLFYVDPHPEVPDSIKRAIDRLYLPWANGEHAGVITHGGEPIAFALNQHSEESLRVRHFPFFGKVPIEDADTLIQLLAPVDAIRMERRFQPTDDSQIIYLINPKAPHSIVFPVLDRERRNGGLPY